MGAPLTEDWYFCPACGSRVTVGSDGCQTCAKSEKPDIDFEYPPRETDVSLTKTRLGESERSEDLDFDEFIVREFHEKSRASLAPVVVALALAVFFVVIFLILAMHSL